MTLLLRFERGDCVIFRRAGRRFVLVKLASSAKPEIKYIRIVPE